MSSSERKKKRAVLVRLYGLYCHWCKHPLVEPEEGVEPFVTPPPDGTRWATLDHVVGAQPGRSEADIVEPGAGVSSV